MTFFIRSSNVSVFKEYLSFSIAYNAGIHGCLDIVVKEKSQD